MSEGGIIVQSIQSNVVDASRIGRGKTVKWPGRLYLMAREMQLEIHRCGI